MKYNETKPVKAVIANAARIADHGIALRFKPGSVMSEASLGSLPIEHIKKYKDLREVMNNNRYVHTTTGQDKLDVTIQRMTHVVRNGLAYFRGNVATDIVSLYKKCTTTMGELVLPSLVSDFDIVEVQIPLPLVANHGLLRIDSFKDGLSGGTFVTKVCLENKLEHLMQGNADVDANIRDWYLTTDRVAGVWDCCFGRPFNSVHVATMLNTLTPIQILNSMLEVYLAASRFLAQGTAPGLNTQAEPEELVKILTAIRKFTGIRINMALRVMENFIKSNILIVGEDKMNKTIFVLGHNYRKFLSEGGTAEAILGRFLDGDGVVSLDDVHSGILRYSTTWNTFVANSRYTRSKALLKMEKQIIINTATTMIRDRYGLHNSDNQVKMAGAKAAVSKYVSGMKVNWKDNAQELFICLVCDAFHPTSYAKNFLLDVEEIAAYSPNLSKKEVDFIATMNYITVYLKSNIEGF